MTILFNNQVTAPLWSSTVQKMLAYLQRKGHPEGYLRADQEFLRELQEICKPIYKLVGGTPSKDRFIFTSSGVEGVNHVILSSYFEITRKTGKNHFLTPSTEEAAPILAMSRLEEAGCIFQMIPTGSDGIVSPQAVVEALSPRTALLSISWANGLTGVIQPVQEIGAICRDRGVLFHVDATHVLGKGDYTLERSGADVLTFNGEQIHAPAGTGGMFVREGVELSPLILGEEQNGLRGGRWPVPSLIGLAEACREAFEGKEQYCMEMERLRELFERAYTPLFADSPRVPNITALSFPGITSDALLYVLNRKGVSACLGGGNFQKISHLLKACSCSDQEALSALSFAFSRETSLQEVEKGLAILQETVQEMNKLSKGLWI